MKIGFSIFFLLIVILFGISCTKDSSYSVQEAKESGEKLSDCNVGNVSSGPCAVRKSGVIVSDDFGAEVELWSNEGGSDTIEADIPNGFYANQKVSFKDINLTPGNIKSGITIFGVAGTSLSPSPACTVDSLNLSACTATAGNYVTSTAGSSVVISGEHQSRFQLAFKMERIQLRYRT